MAGFRFSKNFCAVFQFKCDSILHVRLASHSMILLCPSSPSLFPSRETYNGTASEADRNIISNHVITFQISNFNTFCFPQIPIISYPGCQRFFSRSGRQNWAAKPRRPVAKRRTSTRSDAALAAGEREDLLASRITIPLPLSLKPVKCQTTQSCLCHETASLDGKSHSDHNTSNKWVHILSIPRPIHCKKMTTLDKKCKK